ncbi:MAG TPA: endonuclease/exonuclease/phosphatase family protein [Actinomycetota bacterium]|nr:endonuclease/exonuclease/phosphatase family protein [Actinomycetota bacterium]
MSRRRYVPVLLGAALLVSLSAGPGRAANEGLAREVLSPPGQVVVATVNAEQANVLGLYTFKQLYQLAIALRSRPVAFDGGSVGAVSAPDVLTLQEMSVANVEILQNLLNQRSRYAYELAVADGSKAKFLYNSETLQLLGPPTAWVDPCKSDPGGKGIRMYQFARFAEKASGLTFTLAGIHFQPRYPEAPDPSRCRVSNVAELHRQLAGETNPVIVGGDFNYRATEKPRECDPDERSNPTEWWSLMTKSLVGEPAFVDAVRETTRRTGQSLADEWTFEAKALQQSCTGAATYVRNRIDYLFARGAVVAAAHADHPGWAGETPGTRHPTNKAYSDHRFVLGRFVLGGTPRPQPPVTAAAKGGAIGLTWVPTENATGYALYRARSRGAYALVQRVDATTTQFADVATTHGHRYRYAIAAVGADGAQSFESRGSWATADGRGPRVTGFSPWSSATRVPLGSDIIVRYDERVAPSSVTAETVKLVRKPRHPGGPEMRIAGEVRVTSSHTIEFDPYGKLDRKRTYSLVVRPVLDVLGNKGVWRWSRFTT